jgi:predicted DNA-binding transcriptional regulator YafY
MADEKLGNRLGVILTKLNNGERFTLEELALEFGSTTKTIYRDLTEKLIYFPIKKEGKYYRRVCSRKTKPRRYKKLCYYKWYKIPISNSY